MSIKGDILDDVKAVLETITIANGYNQIVKKVWDDEFKMPDELTSSDFPALFLIDDDTRKEAGDVDSVLCTLNCIVTGYVFRTKSSQNLQSDRRKLENDVEKAIMVDERRSGMAIKTQTGRIVTDRGTLEPHGIFDLHFVVEYFQDRNNPSEQDNNP